MSMRIAPQFLVADLPAALAYYCDKLGFEQKIAYEDFYASVIREGAEIHLKCAPQSPGERQHRLDNGHLDAMIEVDKVAALHAELDARGAHIHQSLQQQPWGNQDFQVLDPDGHILCFSQEVDAPA